MILAPLAHAQRYHSEHPLFPEAFAWLERLAQAPWRPGRHTIRGDELWANLDEGVTRPETECRFESHRRYIDIQLSVAGGECIDWAPVSTLELETDFQPGGDIAFYRPRLDFTSRLLLQPGVFAIFFPEDAHKPLIARDAPAPFRKCVVKVAIDAGG